MEDKLRILFCGEANFIKTGYAKYYKELLSRLVKNSRLHIAEFACYGKVNDPRDRETKWRYYANAVDENDPRYKIYNSSIENHFGKWRLEKVLLDFKPHIVVDIRDFWMNAYQSNSPLRQCFHWLLMPTVDSYPQKDEWIDKYITADSVFTYSDWGADILGKQSNMNIKYAQTASPGIDVSIFKPLNQNQCREHLGIHNPSEKFIIGSVMRNQKRKLIPELVKHTRQFIDELYKEKHFAANQVYLYLHTSFPDYLSWDIPKILQENGMLNRTLMTYVCKNCKRCFVDNFTGAARLCKFCPGIANPASVNNGVDEQTLSIIYNSMNIYVQYAICEGFGMPQIEAAACGLPVASVNYSAMEDIIKKVGAYPLNVAAEFKELETQTNRVYPQKQDLLDFFYKYINMPQPILNKEKVFFRNKCIDNYSWDIIVDKWQSHFEQLIKSGIIKNDTYKQFGDKKYLKKIPEHKYLPIAGMNNLDIMSYIISNYLSDIFDLSSYVIIEILSMVNDKFIIDNNKVNSYTWQKAIDTLNQYIENHNIAIQYIRNNQINNEDFIQYAHLKDPYG